MPSPDAPTEGRRGGAASIASRIVLRLGLAMAIALATLMMLGLALGALPEPRTLSVIKAETETVRFRVGNAPSASFPLAGFRVFGAGDFDDTCAAETFGRRAALEPQLGAQVAYTVLPTGRLLVEIDAFDDGRENAILRTLSPTGRTQAQSVRDDLVFRDDPECGERAAFRMPIWGPGEIGGEPTFRGDGPSATMLSGSLKMHGRATPYRFSLTDPFGLGGGSAGRDDLYPTGHEFDFPPGSRVSTLPADAEASRKSLSGFAIQEGRTLRVEASTESPEVFFYAPGTGKAPDRLRMSLLARIGNDPNLGQIFQILLWFAVVLPIAIELIRPLFARAGEDW